MTWQAELDSMGDTAVLRLHGDLDLLVEPLLRQALNDACTGYRHVLLDLAEVRLIDSTGLGLLVRAHQNAKRNQGVVCLLSPSRFILTVLHTMRLHPVFPIFPDVENAIRWLGHVSAQNLTTHNAIVQNLAAQAATETGEAQIAPAGNPPGASVAADSVTAGNVAAPRSPATGEAGDRGALGRA